ncbi:CLUMA_CG007099, isoform A [Clunio marinus]|uniref:CLUMA_CG007099, isoform A n=1 Tax=Clunio marinus TaxID=568069 RepID=A0A1J1I3X2_9DIPT|nr:CLUMA_CG007099, isoform A [Clunio marinus]
MKLTILLVVICCVAVTLGCDKACQRKKAKDLQKACAELGGGTKIKLEIDIAGGGCRPPCKKRRKSKPSEGGGEAPEGDDGGKRKR